VRSDINEAKAGLQNAGGTTATRKSNAAVNVSDSGQLLLLLKGATPAPGQKIIVAPGKIDSSSRKPPDKSPADFVSPKTPQPLTSPIGPPDKR
jgi:hypothetical protein